MYLSCLGLRSLAAACALALLLSGCSGGDGPTETSSDPGPDPGAQSAVSVVLGSSSVSVTPESSATVAVSVTRSGDFAGTVGLSLTGAPNGLTGTFSPASIPAGATGSTLTLSAAQSVAPGTYSLTIRASGQGVADGTAALQVEIEVVEGAWSVLGEGTDGPVHAIVVDDEGNVYVGGSFTRAGGATVNNIAKWDGSSWSALGTGIIGGSPQTTYVNALALDDDGNLYAGGQFTTAGGVEARNVAMWDGSSWSALGVPPFGIIQEVRALAADSEGNLYAGGNWHGVASADVRLKHIAKWDGTAWSGIGDTYDEDLFGRVSQGVSARVNALVIDGSDNVYLGGEFTTAGGETTANRIVMWDGESWIPLGTGLDGSPALVSALALDESGSLYAGGHFTVAGDVIADNVAVWNGAEWSALGGGIPVSSLLQRVHALETDAAGRLYAGGRFLQSAGAPADHLATWDGAAWGPVGEGLGTRVLALATDGAGNLYAGGVFTGSIAKWSK